jgi:hypothetical protein
LCTVNSHEETASIATYAKVVDELCARFGVRQISYVLQVFPCRRRRSFNSIQPLSEWMRRDIGLGDGEK